MRTRLRRAPAHLLRRTPPRAARRALSGAPPRAVELLLGQSLARVAKALEEAILEELEASLADFAKPDQDEEAKLDAAGDPPGLRPLMGRVRKRAAKILSTAKRDVEATSAKAGVRVEKHSRAEFERLGIKLLEAEPDMGPAIKVWRAENVDRIVSLTARKVDRVETLLRDGAAMRVETLRDRIQETVGATKAQAALIARDQVLKLNSQITTSRHKAAGIEEYIWTCSGDERVRGRPDGLYPDAKPSHWALDGKRFRYDTPPVSGPKGERGHPGVMFQCRCTAYPILPELEAEGLA